MTVLERPPDKLIARAARWREPVTLTLKVGDQIGNATFERMSRIHAVEWHAQRTTGFGGSDVAAACGCSKWTSRYQLWAERTGAVQRRDDGKNRAAKEWGQRLERVVVDKFADDHPELVVMTWPKGLGASFRNIERAYQLASPDALTWNTETGEWGILEAKTARYDDEWKDWDLLIPTVPAYYRTQDQWYLDTFGFTTGPVAALFTGSDYRVFDMTADAFEQRVNREQVESLIELIESKTPPPIDGHDATLAIIRREHPDIIKEGDGAVVEVPGKVGDEYVLALRGLEKAESELNRTKAEMLNAMGSAHRATLNGTTIAARQAQTKAGQPGTPFLVKKIGSESA